MTQPDMSRDAGIFGSWSTASIAAQCRMQARENLDPEYTQFMNAAADTIEALIKERDALRTLAGKVDAIRDSIIGCQSVNWSEHVYPLVAALGEAGYDGQEYESARENVGTLIERTNAAEAERDRLRDFVQTIADRDDSIGDDARAALTGEPS